MDVDVLSLTELDTIVHVLKSVQQQERVVEADLDELLEDREGLESRLEKLHVVQERLSEEYNTAQQLAHTIDGACRLAESISVKVRELDTAQSHVREALKYVEDILDTKSSYEGVQSALEREDFESAAGHIHHYLSVQGIVPSNDPSLEGLREAEQRVKDVVRSKLEEAATAHDTEAVQRFIRLFPKLNMLPEGLSRYARYIRKFIAEEADEDFKEYARLFSREIGAAERGVLLVPHVDVITKLYQQIAGLVEETEELCSSEPSLGPDSLLQLIHELQEQCDVQAVKVLDRFTSDRRLLVKVKECSVMRSPGLQEPTDPEMKELDVLLDEIALLSSRYEVYDAFLRERVSVRVEAIARARAEQKERVATYLFKESFVHDTRLNERMQELIAYFAGMEEFFLVQNVQKAIRLDESVEDSLTSTIVDDVFYVLQKCARRALSTANVQAAGAVCNHINNILGREYLEVLQKRLREPEDLASKMGLGGSGAFPSIMASNPTRSIPKPKVALTTILNNIEVSGEYVVKLRNELEVDFEETFSSADDRGKMKATVAFFVETANLFKEVLQGGLESLCHTILPRIRPLVDTLLNINYELDEQDFAENEINDPFVYKFAMGVDTQFKSYKGSLTSNNFDMLVQHVAQYVTRRIEQIIVQKKFSQLGGLQLDKDIRGLVNFFSRITQRTVRDKFARLSQTASLLSLEKVAEVMEYWGDQSGSLTWRLSKKEVRGVLGLRSDFLPSDIQQLRL